MAEIKDHEAAKAWLRGVGDRRVVDCLSARNAQRMFLDLGAAPHKALGDLSFAAIRATLISTVAAKMQAPTLVPKADAAAMAIRNTLSRSSPSSRMGADHRAIIVIQEIAMHAGTADVSNSVAYSNNSELFSNFNWDVNFIEADDWPANLLDQPLWSMGQEPDDLSENLRELRALWQSAPKIWDFWERWYDGFLNGTPLDWNIQLAVASLPDEDWEKGPEWVAGKIAEIEAGHQRPTTSPLPAEDVATQSVRLLERPLLLETNASGLQQLSQMAVDAYRREISNALPDCIEPLENIPGIAYEIACIAARDVQLSDKEALLAEQIQLMAGVIAELNGRLKRVPEPDASGRKLFADAFYEKSGERVAELIFSKMLWGGVLAGTGFLLGTPGDALIDTLSQYCNSKVAPEASSISNPSITWHAPPKT